jgi:hypothetical protein
MMNEYVSYKVRLLDIMIHQYISSRDLFAVGTMMIYSLLLASSLLLCATAAREGKI